MYRNVRVIPKQLLEQLYVEKQWSVRDVADYFQCSVDTIMRRMKAYDIERRPLKKEINMVQYRPCMRRGSGPYIPWQSGMMCPPRPWQAE